MELFFSTVISHCLMGVFSEECHTSNTTSHTSRAGIPSTRKPASREITSDSVELCETAVCFLHRLWSSGLLDRRQPASKRTPGRPLFHPSSILTAVSALLTGPPASRTFSVPTITGGYARAAGSLPLRRPDCTLRPAGDPVGSYPGARIFLVSTLDRAGARQGLGSVITPRSRRSCPG